MRSRFRNWARARIVNKRGNRIIWCTDVGWEIEADPRHAELVVKQLGIEDKGVSTPGVSGIEEEDEEGDIPLVGRISPDIEVSLLDAIIWQPIGQTACLQFLLSW